MQAKEILWNHLVGEWFQSVLKLPFRNRRQMLELTTTNQASNTISFASLSAHCHTLIVPTGVVYWDKIPKRQQNKETF